jgi:hypothetical protein
MKHIGNKMEYAEERSRDLMRAYQEYIGKCKHIVVPNVCKAIVEMPSRRFWVSEIRATAVVSSIMKGDTKKLKTMRPLKREMYEEIYRRVMLLKKELPDVSLSELCLMVIEQPAPKFYLTAGSAMMYICKTKRKWREQRLQR